jgi:NADH dehydrogenase [ubiquinone] 1 alpha subcomplex assembly factor 5
MTLFDSQAYHLHQKRAAPHFQDYAFLFNHVAAEITARLEDIKRNFTNTLQLSTHPLPCPGQHIPTPEEQSNLPENTFDLILSCLQLHWVNDLPGFLKTIYRSLEPEGLFIGALFGGNTLHELRESFVQAELALKGGASPRIAPMLHPADGPQLLKAAGFFMPVVDRETIVVTYPSVDKLMKDLRGMGETNKLVDRPKSFTPHALLVKTEEVYRDLFSCGEPALPVTFDVMYLTGWKNPG